MKEHKLYLEQYRSALYEGVNSSQVSTSQGYLYITLHGERMAAHLKSF